VVQLASSEIMERYGKPSASDLRHHFAARYGFGLSFAQDLAIVRCVESAQLTPGSCCGKTPWLWVNAEMATTIKTIFIQ